MEEIQIGGLGLSVVITLIMSLLYKITNDKIPDRFRAPLAVACGITMTLLYIPYSGLEYGFKTVMDMIVYGFTYGLSAVGMYEVGWKSTVKPRVK